jgi:hypoxanthine phosphoribosyltransferase
MPKLSLGPVLFTQKQIAHRIYDLGRQISRDYRAAGRMPITLVGVMKGALPFLPDLARALDLDDVQIELVTAESYRGFASTGEVVFSGLAHLNLSGRHAIVVEDIVDSGLTTKHLWPHLQHTQPASLALCTLLAGHRVCLAAVKPDYAGFALAEKVFVVGYGLDYDQKYRNLPDIHVLEGAEL